MREIANVPYPRESIEPGETDSLARIARMIAPGSRVLDLGTARGALGRALSSRGCPVDGVELDEVSAEAARPHYRVLRTADLDTSDLGQLFRGEAYDVVVCADVLEHLKDPDRILQQVRGLLASGGMVLISMPNVGYTGVLLDLLLGRFEYRPRGLLDQTHLRFFTRSSLVRMLERCGFGVSSIEPVRVDLDASEFASVIAERLDPALLAAMTHRPDGLAYQFIAQAMPGAETAPEVRSTLEDPGVGFRTQLYWCGTGEEFDERHASTLFVTYEHSRSKVRFPVPVGARRLRWDPMDRPGVFVVHALELVDGERRRLWASDATELLRAPSRAADVRPVGTQAPATFVALDADPWLELPMGGLLESSQGGELSITFSAFPSEEALKVGEALQRAEERTATVLARSEEVLEVLGKRTESLEAAMHSGVQERRRSEAALRSLDVQVREALGRLTQQLDLTRQLQEEQLRRVAELQAESARKLGARVRRTLGRGLGGLYRLRRELGRRSYAFEPVPLAQVKLIGEGWISTGHDPQIELRPTGHKHPYGLVHLEYELEVDVEEAYLYPDTGHGFDAGRRIAMPSGQRRFVIRLPQNVRRLRVDPRESPGAFRIGHVRMTEISTVELMGQLGGLFREMIREPSAAPAKLRSSIEALHSAGWGGEETESENADLGYEAWVRRYGEFGREDRSRAVRAMEEWSFRPIVSVVMPVYNTPEPLLRAAVSSVIAQVYPQWELCIADDASTDESVSRVLDEMSRKDPRIKVVRRTQNGHISAATNSALALASGEFVVFLDHDDALTPDALAQVVNALNQWPETDLVYSDEDKIDLQGSRFDPAFKPDWSPERLLAQNYVCHLLAIRTELVRKSGGMRVGFEGSQDHDLVLRASELIRPERIRHLPFVLYHWRAIAGSTAKSHEAKPYAQDAGARAVRESIERRNLAAEVEQGKIPHSHRVRYALPDPAPLVSIVIPTRDGLDLLRTCISSIEQKTRYPSYEILVVDNDSTDPGTLGYMEELSSAGRARVLRYRLPFNFSAINNLAVSNASGSLVALLNNDIEVISTEWLREMVGVAIQPGVGAVGAMLLYPDGRIQHAGVATGIGGVAGHLYKREPRQALGNSGELTFRHEVSAVTAACLVIERSKYEQVSGLDAENLRVAFNDVDFCLKLRESGLRNMWTPHAVLYHHESVSRGSDERPARRAAFLAETELMKARWASILEEDPYFSPNYSLQSETPRLAFPPRAVPFYREG